MQIFRVTVNGKAFEVTVEEAGAAQGSPAVASEVTATVEKAAPTPVPVSTAAETPVAVGADDKPVAAPLSGGILAIKVKPGDSVKYGQVLLTLEALKMENEIVAPEDGVVKAIFVKEGNNVNLGDILLMMQ